MFWQIIQMALSTIRSNKMRSLLTILGIVIGITTVVAIAAVIQGLNGWFASQVSSLGSNIVTVTRLPQFSGRFPTEEERQRKELTREDAEAVRQEAKNVEMVTSILALDFQRFPNPNVRSGRVHAANVKVFGVEPDYINVYISSVRSGRFLTDGDVYHRAPVMVLGATVAETMFPGQDPVGKTVFFENDSYEVIGVLEKRGSIFGFDRDNFIWLPITTMLKLHPESKDGLTIAMKANSQDAMPLVMDQVTELMRRRRHVPSDQPNSFDVGSQNQFIDFYKALTGGAYLVAIVIGSISLMVGGIGVMNIMLVSVTERTREIGVRKAIGARRSHILLQFLLEAMVLTGIGGVLGIIAGALISVLVNWLSPVPSAMPVFWIALAFAVSVSVGLFFGIYPAARAAALDPIEALRYE
ncbi:MAG: ABC transporter permease [Candidatus Koribacter versatilis]|uniref:ABC transporter permease n=1 Tax=Candidatus Korobacter versatilis TaxID=658062 RepID=A0A932A904_9BACT|nr:ABC transporter permease [Candidatus Koribacter versatilis]